jgi:glyoxalase family protein
MQPTLLGLHHVTAIADDPQQNVDFYTGVLGLRLVKVTVNRDDPEVYHLHYGDDLGRPGSLLTFYCWPGAIRGRPGTGQVSSTALAVPPGALDGWRARLLAQGIAVDGPAPRGEAEVLSFRDPHGVALELVAHPAVAARPASPRSLLPADLAIRGLDGVTIWVRGHAPTHAFLAIALRLRPGDEVDGVRRYTMDDGQGGTRVDVRTMPGMGRSLTGVGSVHHVGIRVLDDKALHLWRSQLAAHVRRVRGVQDWVYYRAFSVIEPGGVRIELATDEPGMTVDEGPADLGTRLVLPSWLQARRTEL